MNKRPCVYLLANLRHGTLYVGVTSDLAARFYQHRAGLTPGFTSRYGVARLVWFEMHETMEAAIAREKAIKKWNRDWKCNLIERDNPEWRDLGLELGLVEPKNAVMMDSRLRGNDDGIL